MQEDAPFLLATLQQELVAAVIAAQNKLVIDTFAATSGVLTATGVGATVIDMIADAISAQESISGTTRPRSSPTRQPSPRSARPRPDSSGVVQ